MTTTKEAPHHASYAAMRERVSEQMAREVPADNAPRPDPLWEAPRCVLGHIAATPTSCPTCAADRGRP